MKVGPENKGTCLIDPPAKVVQTFEFEGVPVHVDLETMTLEGVGGKTRLVQHPVFQSIEDRDGWSSPVEKGATASNRLGQLTRRVTQ